MVSNPAASDVGGHEVDDGLTVGPDRRQWLEAAVALGPARRQDDQRESCCAPLRAHSLQRKTALGPGHPATEPRQQQVVARVDPAAFDRVVEGERNGRRGRVAVAVDDDHRPLLGDAQALAGGLDDPQVGLVRHHQGDVVGPEAGIGHGPLGRLDHDPDRPAEHLLPVHEQGAAVLALEQVLERPVGVEVPAQQAPGALHRFHDDGARRRRR